MKELLRQRGFEELFDPERRKAVEDEPTSKSLHSCICAGVFFFFQLFQFLQGICSARNQTDIIRNRSSRWPHHISTPDSPWLYNIIQDKPSSYSYFLGLRGLNDYIKETKHIWVWKGTDGRKHQCTRALINIGLDIPKAYTHASESLLHLNFFPPIFIIFN